MGKLSEHGSPYCFEKNLSGQWLSMLNRDFLRRKLHPLKSMRPSLPSNTSNRKLCEYIISYQSQVDLEDSDNNVCLVWAHDPLFIEGLTSAQHATERLEDTFENIVTTATQNTLDEV